MIRFILIRLAEGLVTLLVSSFLVFSALFLAPGDPIAILIGNRTVSDETVAALRPSTTSTSPSCSAGCTGSATCSEAAWASR